MPKNKHIRPPEFFRPLLWSYDFSKVNSDKDKSTIIVNTLNYGDLKHWGWLVHHYGKSVVRQVIESVPATEFRSRVTPLIALIFGIRHFNHAPRGIRRKT